MQEVQKNQSLSSCALCSTSQLLPPLTLDKADWFLHPSLMAHLIGKVSDKKCAAYGRVPVKDSLQLFWRRVMRA